ncbi:MAG TPA: DMT family transporter [Atribacteraceae bacterium]|nr:DMT family transporter [Atribacteraceae bacterium]
MKQLRKLSPLGLIFASIIMWSSAFAGIRAALVAYPPGHLAFFRFLVASLVLGIYSLTGDIRLPDRKDIPILGLLGFLGITVYHIALSYGQLTVTAGSASLLIASSPVFIALLAHFFLGERLSRWGWTGIAVSFLGVVLIALGEGGIFQFERGAFLVLTAAVSTSLYFVFQKPYLCKYSGLELTTYIIWAGTLFMAPFLSGFFRTLIQAPFQSTAAVIYLGVFPAALAYVLWTQAFSRYPASRMASFLYLSPVLAILIAWLWLSEVPTWLSLVGGGIVLGGAGLVNLKGRVSERPKRVKGREYRLLD